jgi:hypothetical protein
LVAGAERTGLREGKRVRKQAKVLRKNYKECSDAKEKQVLYADKLGV